ncbi:hypothetical protein [Agrobacterium radiobacter]|uniref:hypothetical protein n=1 Tax=Agrobacterium radiobacter TaxID=362 RepID=UPI003F875BDA
MTRHEVEAALLLAGLETYDVVAIPNGYGSEDYRGPWWSCHTIYGRIRIGWRKRVIEIAWENEVRITVKDDVTQGDTLIHAYSHAKTVEYLTLWRREAKRLRGG